MACGGKTYYKDNNGYLLAGMLSHRVKSLKPSLTSINTKENLASIANLRCKVKATLYVNDKNVYEDEGEVLFKNNALSGIVIFQLSSIMTRYPMANYKIRLDMLPSMEMDELKDYLNKHNNDISYLFPKMIAKYIVSQNTGDLAYTIKNLIFNVTEPFDFKNAQVTSGGVSFEDLNDELESKIIPNLYFIGEMLDADGLCGGYNLQFAFASADVVCKSINRKYEEK